MIERINPKRKSQVGNYASRLPAITLLSACIVFTIIGLQIPCYAAERSAIGPSRADAMLADYFRAETAKLRDVDPKAYLREATQSAIQAPGTVTLPGE